MIVFGGVALPRVSGTIATLGDGAAYDPKARHWATLNPTGAPSGRYWHTSVWTGKEMIVWGGTHDGTNPLDDGGVYAPAAESWAAVPSEGAPHARYDHSAVWTGIEMIVWGGLGCSYNALGALPCSDGGAYNPTTHGWRPISRQGAPTQVSEGSQATWAYGKMLAWGGSDSPGGGVYDPATDRWAPMETTGQPAPRVSHVALWTGSELIVWGGQVTEFTAALDGARFRLSR